MKGGGGYPYSNRHKTKMKYIAMISDECSSITNKTFYVADNPNKFYETFNIWFNACYNVDEMRGYFSWPDGQDTSNLTDDDIYKIAKQDMWENILNGSEDIWFGGDEYFIIMPATEIE